MSLSDEDINFGSDLPHFLEQIMQMDKDAESSAVAALKNENSKNKNWKTTAVAKMKKKPKLEKKDSTLCAVLLCYDKSNSKES